MKKILSNVVSIIVTLLIAIVLTFVLTNAVLAISKVNDKSSRGVSMEDSFSGSFPDSDYNGDHGTNIEYWFQTFYEASILCAQHGTTATTGRNGKDPTFSVDVELFDEEFSFDKEFTSWTDNYSKTKEDFWTNENDDEDSVEPEQDDPTIDLTFTRDNHPSNWYVGEDSAEKSADKEVSVTLYANGWTEYSSGDSPSFTNNAMAYILAECAADGGLTPGASYINVAFWSLQHNADAKNSSVNTEYFTGGNDISLTVDSFKEIIKSIDELLKNPNLTSAQRKQLEKAKKAAQSQINGVTTTGEDLVNKVTPEAASAANSLYQEASIFGQMWGEINDPTKYNGNYMNSVKDNTKKITGNNYENLHVQFHTEKDNDYNTFYIVGPFQMEYLEYYTAVSGRKGGQFCGLTGIPELYVKKNGTETKLTYETDWKFEYSDKFNEDSFKHERRNFPHIPDDYNVYPHSGENFFIKIRFQDGITELSKMKFYFRVLEASGSYTRYEGKINTQKWKAKVTVDKCEDGHDCDCDDGSNHTEAQDFDDDGDDDCPGNAEACEHGFFDWHYCSADLEVTEKYNGKSQDAQDFAYVDNGSREYKGGYYGDANSKPTDMNKTFTWNIDLTTTLSGTVWADEDPQKVGGVVNGEYETGTEKGVQNVEVRVFLYDRDTKSKYVTASNPDGYATMYDSSNKKVSFPLFTNSSGKWNHENYRFQAPGEAQKLFYVVEYQYDGQFFNDTLFLEKNGAEQISARAYDSDMNGGSGAKERSKATTEVAERKAFDNSFGIIRGKDQMSDGATVGETESTDSTGNGNGTTGKLEYKVETGNTADEKVPNIVTSRLDEPMYEYDTSEKEQKFKNDYYNRYRLKATTFYTNNSSPDGLFTIANYQTLYPANAIYFMDKIKTSVNNSPRYADEYMRHLNLGLSKRKKVDTSLTKDLYKVTIVVNEQKEVYKFNPYSLQYGDYINLETNLEKIKTAEGNYTIGLYDSDLKYNSKYHYRDALARISNDLKKNTELRVFATYTVRLYNNSELDEVKFKEVLDYTGPDYTLVQSGQSDYDIQNGFLYSSIINDQMKRETTRIAEAPYYRICESNKTYTWGATKEENLNGFTNSNSGDLTWQKVSDNKYKTTTLDSNNLKIRTGEYIEIFTTYEIDKAGYDAVKNSGLSEADTIAKREKLLINDGHINTAEISSYSTYYGTKNTERNHITGVIAGRVDKDSAPNNIVYGSTNTYEDDTYQAPALIFNIKVHERSVNGVVFEDEKTKDVPLTTVDFAGNVDSAGTQNLKVGDGVYTAGEKGIKNVDVSLYEVVNLGSIDDKTLNNYAGLEYYYKVPGYGVTTDENGNYVIDGFLTGDYVLRFDYGIRNDDTATIYSREKPEGETKEIIKYNGQDYENTGFLGDQLFDKSGNNLNMKFLPIDGKDDNKLCEKTVSKARDNESRRLEVVGYSRTLENERAEILRDRVYKIGNEFVENTKMFAETPIMRVEVEDPTLLNTTVKEPENPNTNIFVYEYGGNTDKAEREKLKTIHVNIKNINFGLEERARTDIELKTTVSDIYVYKANEEVFRVHVNDDGTIDYKADTVHARKLVTKPSTYRTNQNQQGFYAIEIEASYLDGLQLQTVYKTKVINNSEIDFTSRLAGLYREDVIDKYAKDVPTSREYEDLVNYYKEVVKTGSEEITLNVDQIKDNIFRLNTNATSEIYGLSDIRGDAKSKEMGGQIKSTQTTDTIKPEVIVYGLFTGRYYYENRIYNLPTNKEKYVIRDYVSNDKVEPIEVEYERDRIVRTAVNELVNYVDIDAEFDLPTQGFIANAAWIPQANGDSDTDQLTKEADGTITYSGDYKVFDGILSDASVRDISGNDSDIKDLDYFDNKDRKYILKGSSNIGFSKNDAIETKAADTNRRQYRDNTVRDDDNRDLTKELEPLIYVLPNYVKAEDKAEDKEFFYDDTNISKDTLDKFIGTITIYTVKETSSSDSADEIIVDNLTEVLSYSNTAGRKDEYSVPGNALSIGATASRRGKLEKKVWFSGYNSIRATSVGRNVYKAMNLIDDSARANSARVINKQARQWTVYPEDDQWAPEYVAVIPPTGIPMREFVKNNLPIVMAATLVIIGLGVIFIDKQRKIRKNK